MTFSFIQASAFVLVLVKSALRDLTWATFTWQVQIIDYFNIIKFARFIIIFFTEMLSSSKTNIKKYTFLWAH